MVHEPLEYFLAEELAASIEAGISGVTRPVLGIDGAQGSGKTALARRLATLLDATVLDLEDFSDGSPGGGYRLSALRIAVASSKPPVIVEGVCLLQVMQSVQWRLTRLVYVKRTGPMGVWYDAAVCEPRVPVEELLERERAALRAIAEVEAFMGGEADIDDDQDPLSGRSEQVLRYHAEFRPTDRADYFFCCPAA